MAERIDCAVIGAGVVGLAIARALARAGREVVILEAESAIGTGSSSRNSEVVHAGLYYARGSHKARTCIRGRELLYAFCREHQVGHRRCGKLVVATADDELPALRRLQQQAIANGVGDLQWLCADAARGLEPELHCTAALHSPSTGIVDSHGLMRALLAEAEAHGAVLALQSPVLSGSLTPGELRLEVGGAQSLQLIAAAVVNSAGLQAPALAARFAGRPAPQSWHCKGSYFTLAAPSPFARLVYPLHDGASLGVHLTLDLAGRARFGPDVEWLEPHRPADLDVDPRRADGFYAAVRRYWPGLRDGALLPAYAGLRSRLSGPGQPPRDFAIEGTEQHGIPGLVQLLGIESPGLTAALALGEHVAAQLTPRRA